MKRVLTVLFMACAGLMGQRANMLGDVEGADKWPHKVNVKTDVSEDKNLLTVTLTAKDFQFGWFQHNLPQVENYADYSGIYGRYRSRQFGNAILYLLFPHENAEQEYYRGEIGELNESEGEWMEFYIPFAELKPERNARMAVVKPSLLSTDNRIEISINNLVGEETVVEFDSLCLLGKDETKAVEERLAKRQIDHLLVKESNLQSEGVHPRLLLHGDFLKKIQAKATAGGNAQLGYETLLRHADGYLKSFNADDPFGKILSFEAQEGLTAHQKRGSFEGALVPAVRPIEVLAAVGLLTGDEQYSRLAARGLVNMARSLDVKSPQLSLGFYYTRTFYVRALAFGYDWLWAFLTPEERHDVKATLLGLVTDIYDKSWKDGWGRHPLNRVWNWDPGLVSCAGLGLLAMEGETRLPESAMLIELRRHLRDYLTFGLDFDGCGHEGPGYLAYGIGAGVEFAECLRQLGRGDLFTETNWQIIAPWIVSEMLPHRALWNNLSDCGHGRLPGNAVYSYTCGRLAELARQDPMKEGERYPATEDLTNGLQYMQHFREMPGERKLSYGAMAALMGWAWKHTDWENSVKELAPASALAYTLFHEDCDAIDDPGRILPEGLLFRGRGLVSSRVGYDNDSLFLAVEAGPHAAGHDQGDKATFTYYGYGQDFFIDSGYGNDGFPMKSGGSFAHNVVLVDGEGQPCRWHNNSSGEITGYHYSKEFDWIRADAKTAWNASFTQWVERPTGRNIAVAERQFVHVRGDGKDIPPYLVVYDDIRKNDDNLHDFTWQWHYQGYMHLDTKEKGRWTLSAANQSTKVLTTRLDYKKGKAYFDFTVPKDGDYKFCALTAAGGQDPGKSDSFSVVINGDMIASWDTSQSPMLCWTPVFNRGEGVPRKYSFKQGDKVTVELRYREPEAELACMMMMPFAAELPVGLDDRPEGCVLLTAEEARLDDANPLLLADFKTANSSKAQVTVYPVMTPDGENEISWFETSRNGIHPKLSHTVKGVKNPNFIMVIVPQQDANGPLPTAVTKLADGQLGAEIHWGGGNSDRIVFPPADADGISRSMEFTRLQDGNAVLRWSAKR